MAKNTSSIADLASVVLRLGLGLMMIFGHGLGKLQSLIGGTSSVATLGVLLPEHRIMGIESKRLVFKQQSLGTKSVSNTDVSRLKASESRLSYY